MRTSPRGREILRQEYVRLVWGTTKWLVCLKARGVSWELSLEVWGTYHRRWVWKLEDCHGPGNRWWQPDQGGGNGGGEKWFWIYFCKYSFIWAIPGGSDGNESACNAGDPGSIPGSGRSPGEGNGNSLHSSRLENPKDGGVWRDIFLKYLLIWLCQVLAAACAI